MIRLKILRLCLLASSAMALTGCVPPKVAAYVSTHPAFQRSVGEPSQVGPDLNGYSQATVPQSGTIAVEGDGVVYGATAPRRRTTSAQTTQSKTPFPEILERLLMVHVENRGQPGDTIAQGEARWVDSPSANLLILAYGYSDAKAKTPAAEFAATLNRMLTVARARRAAVMLLVPPAFADPKLSAAAEPYRNAFRQVQSKFGIGVLELSAALAGTSPHPTDGSYQTDKGYRAIAYTIAPYIAVAPAAKRLTPSL